jgi:hypothetical protein
VTSLGNEKKESTGGISEHINKGKNINELTRDDTMWVKISTMPIMSFSSSTL